MRIRYSTAIPEPEEPMLLPVQFHPARTSTPERRLMAAVLQRAVDDLAWAARAPRNSEAQAMREAVARWINVEQTDWPFSFRAICDEFGLGVEWIRRLLASATTLEPSRAA